jgi:hypothetical protein
MIENIYVTPQPSPIKSGGDIVADLVISDMHARKKFGYEKYGTYLRTENGRNGLVDIYQELQDACIYIRAEIEENFTEPGDFW